MELAPKFYPFLFLVLFGCVSDVDAPDTVVSENDSEVDTTPDFLIPPFDTLEVISQMEIVEHNSDYSNLNEEIDGLNAKVDTLELTYYFGFCDCQRWVIREIHESALTEHPDLDELDPRGQVQFNLDEHGYYVEPATKELEVDGRTHVNGTTIRFIGREYTNTGLPKGVGFTVPDPPSGKVFRYYSYEVLKPYLVWGPDELKEVSEYNGESLISPAIITVK